MIQSWKKRSTGESTRYTTSKEKKEESTEKVPREKKYVWQGMNVTHQWKNTSKDRYDCLAGKIVPTFLFKKYRYF